MESPIKTSSSSVTQQTLQEAEESCTASCPLKQSRRSSLKRCHENNTGSLAKKSKRSISFSVVTAYYFPRTQGFTCVPSQGGSTLGMALKHSHFEQLSLQEHAEQQKRIHKKALIEIQKKKQDRLMRAVLSSEPIETSESSEDSDEEDVCSETTDSEIDLDTYCFLQPVSTKQRKTLLEEAGVPNIENSEKDDCKEIRDSREVCGCSCETYCDPETCECAKADINCQVDRQSFPCSCTKDSCGNPSGRIEFNPLRVRTHYIRTLMRLQLEAANRNPNISVEPITAEGVEPPQQAPPFYSLQNFGLPALDNHWSFDHHVTSNTLNAIGCVPPAGQSSTNYESFSSCSGLDEQVQTPTNEKSDDSNELQPIGSIISESIMTSV